MPALVAHRRPVPRPRTPRPSARLALAVAFVLAPVAAGAAPNALPQDAPGGQVREAATATPIVRTADAAEVERLLKAFAAAEKEKRAEPLKEVLERMLLLDNAELVEPAVSALRYSASKEDKRFVKDEASLLGISKRSEIAAMVIDLECDVQVAGAAVLASIPGADGRKALLKALGSKPVQKERPRTLAAVLEALGTLGEEKAAEVALRELSRSRTPELARASIRYFGQVKTKDLDAIRALIGRLDPPQPANVDAASNPPASFWEAQWKTWTQTRRDVVWALLQITGQTWKPGEGDFASDAPAALKWVEENAKRMGFR